MKKKAIIIICLVLILAAVAGLIFYKKACVDTKQAPEVKTEGVTYHTTDGNETEPVPSEGVTAPQHEETTTPLTEETTTTQRDETTTTQCEETTVAQPEETTAAPVIMSETDRILSNMTLEQKVYQMFIVTPNTIFSNGDKQEMLAKRPVGGIVYFASDLPKNSKDAAMQMLSDTKTAALNVEGMLPFLCVDEEGGRVLRVGKAGYGYETIGPMGNVKSEEEAYNCGATIGAYLKEIGFTVDFAPDADVITNELNTVIGDRSFGTDPETVTKYATAFANGLSANGILSAFKHFPGHGGTVGDTHEGFAYTDQTYEQLYNAELLPFRSAQTNGIPFVMVAHISAPNIIGDNTPCSLSKKMLTDILRGELGYEGLIITDALNMGAIVNEYSSAQASVMAVMAGADVLLMPENLDESVNAILTAVKEGKISTERIDESVRRIINTKLTIKETKTSGE